MSTFKPIYKCAIDLVKLEQSDHIQFWWELSKNSNPNAIHILKNNLDKVNWERLSGNPNALRSAIHILKNNLDKVNWSVILSINPGAITHPNISTLIQKVYPFMDMYTKMLILQNPHIFALDTKAMMDQCKSFCEELCANALSPARFTRHLDMYNYIIGVDEIWENDDI